MLHNIDMSILWFIQEHMKSTFLDGPMILISAIGGWGILWAAAAAGFLCSKKYRKYGAALLVALALCLLVGNLGLKNLVARERPFTTVPDFLLLVREPLDFSFPSGHSMTSFAAADVIFAANRKLGWGAFAAAALIAFSRLYLFVHYPSDVLAGILLGLLTAAFVLWAFRLVRRPKPSV